MDTRVQSEELTAADRLLAVWAVLAVAVFLFVGIGRPVWLDEANSILISSRGPAGIVDSLRQDNNLPVFYLLLWGWMQMFGDSEIALRLLTGAFYVGGFLAAGALAYAIFQRKRAALYGSVFYLASVQAIHQAQNIRMYSLLGMFAGVSTLAFVRLARDPGTRRLWAFYIAWNTLGLFTHVWFGFVIAAQVAAAGVWKCRFNAFLRAAVVPALTFAALWGPIFWAQLHNGATAWMPPFQFVFVPDVLLQFYGVVPGLLVYGTLLLIPGKRFFEPQAVRLGATVFGLSLLFPLAVSVFKPIYWPGRYTIIALAPLAAILGAVFTRFLPSPAAAGLCAGLLAFGAAGQFTGRERVPESDLPAGQSDRTTALYILRHAAPGDALVFTSLTRASADYYFRRTGTQTRFAEISFPEENARHLGWTGSKPCDLLEREADTVVPRLRRLVEAGHTVWVYYGFDPEISNILVRKLEAAVPLQRVEPLRGPYHAGLRIYGAKR